MIPKAVKTQFFHLQKKAYNFPFATRKFSHYSASEFIILSIAHSADRMNLSPITHYCLEVEIGAIWPKFRFYKIYRTDRGKKFAMSAASMSR